MNTDVSSESNLEAQAAEWVVCLHYLSDRASSSNPQASAERNAQFVLWLQQSARHVAAFMRADDEFCRLEGMDPKRQIDIDKLLLRPKLIHRDASGALTAKPTTSRRRARRRMAMVASVVVAVCAVFGWSAYQHAHVFVTGVGEQRVVKLPDGSTMMLNTSSRAHVDFSARARRIRLDEGEALFSVEHDADRPFLVVTPTAIVRAVGTQFDVYQRPNATTTITVLEGVVRFASMRELVGIAGFTNPTPNSKDRRRSREVDATAQTAAPLAAGQQALVAREKVSTSNDANAPDEIAWRDRLLVFRGRSLSEVADEFNRYNTAQIRILDPEVGELRISGTYSVDRPQVLALYLREDSSLDVEQQGDDWIVRKR